MTNFLKPSASEWANTSLSTRSVAYSCGAIRRSGETFEHDHDPVEWKVCRQLSDEAARVMKDVEVGMGSSSYAFFNPFYLVASKGSKVPVVLTEEFLRAAFGGTLYPGMSIVIEPLEKRGAWWTKVREYLVDNDDALKDKEEMADGKTTLKRWNAMVRWFGAQTGLHGSAFVMMEGSHLSKPDWCCIDFPYIALGITNAGSLVGIWGPYCDH